MSVNARLVRESLRLRSSALVEAVSCRVVHPWVVVRTPDAGLEIDRLAGDLLARQLARVRYPTGRGAVDDALLPPRFEVLGFRDRPGVLDPLDNLRHGDEIDVVVLLQNLVDPVQESVQEFGIVLEPSGVEVKTDRSPVLIVMSVEIVIEEIVKLISREYVGAGVDHGASRKVLVKVGVFAPVEFVHDHFPDGVASGRAVLEVAVAAMWHPEVHGVWPERRVGQGGGDGGVVEEGLFLHHGELVVAAHPQVGGSDADYAVVCDIRVLFHDNSHPCHFLSPVVNGGVRPQLFVIVVAATNKLLFYIKHNIIFFNKIFPYLHLLFTLNKLLTYFSVLSSHVYHLLFFFF